MLKKFNNFFNLLVLILSNTKLWYSLFKKENKSGRIKCKYVKQCEHYFRERSFKKGFLNAARCLWHICGEVCKSSASSSQENIFPKKFKISTYLFKIFIRMKKRMKKNKKPQRKNSSAYLRQREKVNARKRIFLDYR